MRHSCAAPTGFYRVIRALKDATFCDLLKRKKIDIAEFREGYLIYATSDQFVDPYVEDFLRELKFALLLYRADPGRLTLIQLQQSDPVSAYLRLQAFEDLQEQDRLASMALCDANWEAGE